MYKLDNILIFIFVVIFRWLLTDMELKCDPNLIDIVENVESSSIRGRSHVKFEYSSERSKRRKSQELRANYSAEELTYAAQMKIRESGNTDAANICKKVFLSSPTRSTKMREKIDRKAEIPYEPHMALSHLLNTSMSKSTYIYLRKAARERHCNL